jgi:hypothetical protein
VATTAGLTTTAALVIYYDDQLQSTSVSISNFPASQVISGTVTANPTGTQTIAGTVTANVPNIQVCTQGAFAQTSAIQTALGVINENNNSQVLAVFGGEAVEGEGTSAFVQVRNQISGTVTANLDPNASVIAGQIETGIANYAADLANDPLPISGTVTIGSALPTGTNRIGVVTIGAGTVTLGASTSQIGSVTANISGTVPISISSVTVGNSVTIGSLPALVAGTAQIGSVTASISGTVPISISSVTVGNSITIGSLPAISGTVTANSSNGSLTTQFGSVVTANTAFATSAVTNANRKYLLIQNITTASNVITVGIGFTPTTTQGIQLFAGAGLTFEGSYIPTGAVNLLSSVTASCYTILEA